MNLVSGKRLCRVLEAHGQNLKIGTLRQLLKDTGLTADDL